MNGRPTVKRGRVQCPHCGGTLVGMVDVTVHPSVRFVEGRLVQGPLVDTMRGIRHDAASYGASIFGGDPDKAEPYAEVYCADGCDYTIGAHELHVMLVAAQEAGR